MPILSDRFVYKILGQLSNTKYLERLFWTNSVRPWSDAANAASEQGLHCLPPIQQFLYIATGSTRDLFKCKDKYDKKINPCHAE